MKRSLSFAFVLVPLICLISYIQSNLATKKIDFSLSHYPYPAGKNHQDILYIPIQSKILKLIAPSSPSFLSDLLWMRTTYYYGFHATTDKQFPYLTHLLDIITDLSPNWELPYYFGAILLPFEAESVPEGYYIIEKAIHQFPGLWQYWFFKGFYEWKVNHDIIEASQSFIKASLLPNAPDYLKTLPLILHTRDGQKELYIRFLQESIQHAKNEEQRNFLLRQLEELLHGK